MYFLRLNWIFLQFPFNREAKKMRLLEVRFKMRLVSIFFVVLISACSQLNLPVPDMKSSSPLIDLTDLPGVQATDIRMIDNDVNTSGELTHEIAQGLQLSNSILYNSEDASKTTWAVIVLPEEHVIRNIKVYSKSLGNATVVLYDKENRRKAAKDLHFKTTSSGAFKIAEVSTGLAKANIIKIRAASASARRGSTSVRHFVKYKIEEIYITGY